MNSYNFIDLIEPKEAPVKTPSIGLMERIFGGMCPTCQTAAAPGRACLAFLRSAEIQTKPVLNNPPGN